MASPTPSSPACLFLSLISLQLLKCPRQILSSGQRWPPPSQGSRPAGWAAGTGNGRDRRFPPFPVLNHFLSDRARSLQKVLLLGPRDTGWALVCCSPVSCSSRHCREQVERGGRPWHPWGFPGGSDGKESACNSGEPGSIPGSGRFSEEGNVATSILACRIPWKKEPGRLQSMGSQRVGHD